MDRQKIIEMIPEEETSLRMLMEETDYPKETFMEVIGWPTDSWHWDVLCEIEGKPYEVLQPEMEPED